MAEVLQREWIYLWYYVTVQLEQLFPYWILGMVLGSAISVFAKRTIHGLMETLGRNKGAALPLLPASVLGIASPLCMYGTIPLAASFSRMEMRDDLLAAFMMSSILLNPQLIIYSAALGRPALIIRVTCCFLCGVIAGLAVRFFYGDEPFFRFSSLNGPVNHDTAPNPLVRFLKNLGRNVRAKAIPDRGNYCSVRNPRQILLRQGLPGVLFMRIPVRSWPRPPEYPRIRCHCSGSPPSVGSVCSISRPSHAPRSSE